MQTKELLIENKLGLHARAAAQIVKTTNAFTCKIVLSRDGVDVDGKSIMGIMMLAAAKGTTVQVRTDGKDEDRAMEDLQKLFRDKFGEKE